MQVATTDIIQNLPPAQWNRILRKTPEFLRKTTQRLYFQKDQQLHLSGRLLLLQLLTNKNWGWEHLEAGIGYDENRRPHFHALPGDFNISHSGTKVFCVVSDKQTIGGDIEEIRQVVLTDFKRVMNDNQWFTIHQHQNPLLKFFQYWTIKESVIKADGRGLQMSLPDLLIKDRVVSYHDKFWHYQQTSIGPGYCGAIASNLHLPALDLQHINNKRLMESWL